MSNSDRIWNEEDAREARADGWLMAITVDSGRSGSYYSVYPHGPRFGDPHRAKVHVVNRATEGSKLHARALQIITQTRMAK